MLRMAMILAIGSYVTSASGFGYGKSGGYGSDFGKGWGGDDRSFGTMRSDGGGYGFNLGNNRVLDGGGVGRYDSGRVRHDDDDSSRSRYQEESSSSQPTYTHTNDEQIDSEYLEYYRKKREREIQQELTALKAKAKTPFLKLKQRIKMARMGNMATIYLATDGKTYLSRDKVPASTSVCLFQRPLNYSFLAPTDLVAGVTMEVQETKPGPDGTLEVQFVDKGRVRCFRTGASLTQARSPQSVADAQKILFEYFDVIEK